MAWVELTDARLAGLRDRLEAAKEIASNLDRLTAVAAVITDGLENLGVRPVVVGGLAVAIWTGDQHLTDIDVLMPSSDDVYRRMEELGFEIGSDRRHWELPGSNVLLEAPGSYLDPREGTEAVEVDGGIIYVERPEDVLIMRLKEQAAVPHDEVLVQILSLLHLPSLDDDYLDRRVKEENLEAALDHVRTQGEGF